MAVPERDLVIDDESALAKFKVCASQRELGVVFGRSREEDGVTVAATRPDESLLVGPLQSLRSMLSGLPAGTIIVDVSHGLAILRLTGDTSSAFLGLICDLDFSEDMTPDGSVASAFVAGVACDIIRQDVQSARSYRIVVDRSLARHLASAIGELLDDDY